MCNKANCLYNINGHECSNTEWKNIIVVDDKTKERKEQICDNGIEIKIVGGSY
ncbi:MAG: hypothetical protein ACRDA4_08060 [Filifactoraceae bacterium]